MPPKRGTPKPKPKPKAKVPATPKPKPKPKATAAKSEPKRRRIEHENPFAQPPPPNQGLVTSFLKPKDPDASTACGSHLGRLSAGADLEPEATTTAMSTTAEESAIDAALESAIDAALDGMELDAEEDADQVDLSGVSAANQEQPPAATSEVNPEASPTVVETSLPNADTLGPMDAIPIGESQHEPEPHANAEANPGDASAVATHETHESHSLTPAFVEASAESSLVAATQEQQPDGSRPLASAAAPSPPSTSVEESTIVVTDTLQAAVPSQPTSTHDTTEQKQPDTLATHKQEGHQQTHDNADNDNLPFGGQAQAQAPTASATANGQSMATPLGQDEAPLAPESLAPPLADHTNIEKTQTEPNLALEVLSLNHMSADSASNADGMLSDDAAQELDIMTYN